MKKITKVSFETSDGYKFSFEGEKAQTFCSAVAKLWEQFKEEEAKVNTAFEDLLAILREKNDDQT